MKKFLVAIIGILGFIAVIVSFMSIYESNSKIENEGLSYMKNHTNYNVKLPDYVSSLHETNSTEYLQYKQELDRINSLYPQPSILLLIMALGFIGTLLSFCWFFIYPSD